MSRASSPVRRAPRLAALGGAGAMALVALFPATAIGAPEAQLAAAPGSLVPIALGLPPRVGEGRARPEPRRRNPAAAAARLCEAEIARAAKRHGVPHRLLLAVALTESGRRVGDRRRPWPWTVNGAGEGRWLASPQAALALTTELSDRGIRSYDVGCMQVNQRWHGRAFASVAEMFDPAKNVDYAARFLKALAAETGDWIRAAGLYHSRTPKLAARYRNKVAAAYAKLDAADLAVAPAPDEAAPRPAAAERAPLMRDVALAQRAHKRFALVGATGPLLRAASGGGLLGTAPARPLFDAAPARGGLFENRPAPPASGPPPRN